MPEHTPATPSRLDRLVRRAQWVLAVEGLWPPVVLAAGLLAGFTALSWFGLWAAVPRPVRIFGVACTIFGLAAAALAAWRGARPSRARALERLDRDAGAPHRPVSASEDALANAGTDPVTRALWELHRRRLEAVLARVTLARPAPDLARHDPYALRLLALLLLVAAGFVAGADKGALFAAAFDWHGGAVGPASAGYRVDAWADPPAYTGKPPVVLFAPDQAGQPDRAVTVPAGSTIVVRAAGAGTLDLQAEGGLKPVERPAAQADAKTPRSPDERAAPPAAAPDPGERFTLTGRARLTVGHDGSHLATVQFTAVPDMAPTIALQGPLKPAARGGFALDYRIDDDYGVVGAEAAFSDPALDGAPVKGRVLVAPPKLALALAPGPGGLGVGHTAADLSDSPWAGTEVTLTLSARDEGGNLGLSAPVRVILPARPFTQPLARALVEQRRNLVLDPDHRERVETALDALMIAPDRFGTSDAVYLGLSSARGRLGRARSDADLTDVADLLWQMALRIEDGDLSQSQRDVRAAEQALRDALARGAPPEEVKRLTDELRQAMDKMLAEMMRQNAERGQQGAKLDSNARRVTPQDLQRMVQQMEDAARAGDTETAQRMLDQLQNLLDNLKTAKGGSDDASREMNRQMGELDRMTRDQGELRNKTFKRGKDARRSQEGAQNPGAEQPGQGDDADEDADSADDGNQQGAGQHPDEQSRELGRQQQALRERLQQLEKSLRGLGMKGEQGLDDAEQAMKDAEGALGQGLSGNRRAVDAQGRALQGLQQGANGLTQQMAQGQEDGSGEGQGAGREGQGSASGSDTDPLGRRRDARGSVETRGNEIGQSVAERAQRVLEELRRRLGDPTRPQEEQDYLQRLLRHY